jgi:hypothetical protein
MKTGRYLLLKNLILQLLELLQAKLLLQLSLEHFRSKHSGVGVLMLSSSMMRHVKLHSFHTHHLILRLRVVIHILLMIDRLLILLVLIHLLLLLLLSLLVLLLMLLIQMLLRLKDIHSIRCRYEFGEIKGRQVEREIGGLLVLLVLLHHGIHIHRHLLVAFMALVV